MDENGSDNTGLGQVGQDGGRESGHLRLASIDHEEYDALADLFLGDGGFAPEPIYADTIEAVDDSEPEDLGEPEPEPTATETEIEEDLEDRPTHATHTPVLQLTRHEDDAELGSRLGSGQRADDSEVFDDQVAGLHVLETLAATDARASELLAELMGESGLREDFSRTIEDESADEIEFIPMPDPVIEVVVLGHLPVRATLWARQYACNQSKELCETVALVRAASGSTSVDLITDGGTHGQSVSVRSYDRLDEALIAVSRLADRVIMRVDEASEAELLDRPEIEEITVLTGADEAAVVASYRLIKTLDATLGEQYVEGEGPTLRVAVMGAGREMAMDACTKLGNAVETFIQRPIEIVVGSGRIDATGTTSLYRDSSAHRALEILDGLVQAARVGHEDVEESGNESVDLQLADAELAAATEAVVEAKPSEQAEPMRVEFSSSGVEMPEPRKARRQSDDDAPSLRDGLCAMIPGLKPIEARCPKAPGVDLAVDSDGRLHLIVCDADTRDAMNRLLAAQTWARNNLGLLLRAETGISVPAHDRDVDTDATMHLISIEPRSVREIYDTQVRIYSLARVKVAGVIAQVATPIN